MELGCITLLAPIWKLSKPHAFGMFMEASSHIHDWLLTHFPALLPSLEDGGWAWKFQASNHGLVFLVTSPYPGAHPESPHWRTYPPITQYLTRVWRVCVGNQALGQRLICILYLLFHNLTIWKTQWNTHASALQTHLPRDTSWKGTPWLNRSGRQTSWSSHWGRACRGLPPCQTTTSAWTHLMEGPGTRSVGSRGLGLHREVAWQGGLWGPWKCDIQVCTLWTLGVLWPAVSHMPLARSWGRGSHEAHNHGLPVCPTIHLGVRRKLRTEKCCPGVSQPGGELPVHPWLPGARPAQSQEQK